MSNTEPETFDPAYWEQRHRRAQASGSSPSPTLIAEAESLKPARALDAGCGFGQDAIWLAERGWQVLALDVSPTALERGSREAESLGSVIAKRIEWVEADVLTWEPLGLFDLVSSQYVHVPGSQEVLLTALGRLVAPGGTLLIAGHAPHGHEHGRVAHEPEGSRPPGAELRPEQLLNVLDPAVWSVLVAEARTYGDVNTPGAHAPREDLVLRAQRY